jgi:hypothetical protein
MELKCFEICGAWVFAENKDEAIEIFENKYTEIPNWCSEIKEKDINEFFCYFDIDEINEEDYEYIYDKKNIDEKIRVSLKRPHAMKYGKLLCNEKKIEMIMF